MASPFYLFRKYQKAFLVVAGVLAMFIFVVADPLMSWLQSSSGGRSGPRSAGTVVATWNGGSLNVQQLNHLAQRRLKISDFLRGLYITAATSVEQEGGTPLPPTLPNFIIENNNFSAIQVNCVSTRVLAELAKKSGISISDDVVNHYLREWGLRRTGDSQISTLLDRVGLNDKTLFAGLRELLMGNFYINSYSLATLGIMPEERWQDWKRINERIAVEAAILPAEKFLDEVPEPDEAQLEAFYELHKDRIAGTPDAIMGVPLPSPNPGFREPRRVKLQYLLGSLDDWTQKLSDSVTEAEIADYYERNKRAQFVKTSTSTSAEGLFDDEEESSDDDVPDGDDSDDASADDEATSSEASEESTESDAETPATESEAPAEDESGHLSRKSPFRLAALQTESEEEEEEEEASEEAPAEETAAAAAVVVEDEDTEVDTEEPVEYVPLSEVSEQIRRLLAQDQAVVEMQKVVDRTYVTLQSAYNPYGFKVVTARTEEKEIPSPPSKLADYKAIATETGLASEETVLLSGQELAETFVGRSRDAQNRREFVVQAMFGEQELYEPYRAIDLGGNAYIVCKVEDVPSRVPEFDEVRDAVLAAWKKQEAAKLALAKAKELAKQAETSGDTVAVVTRGQGYEIVTTDMFSWLTFGTTQAEMRRGPRLGEAPPLEAVGVEFMTKAFKLAPDQKLALLNHDQTNAYVIQLDRREQAADEMRQRFLAEANNWYGGRVMSSVRGGASQRQLLGQLSEQAGLNLDKLEKYLSNDSQ